MTSINAMQIGFFASFFSLMFGALGVYAGARLLGAFFVKKMHDDEQCPVCKTPMEHTTLAHEDEGKPQPVNMQPVNIQNLPVSLEARLDTFLLTVKSEQFEAIVESGIFTVEQLETIRELLRAKVEQEKEQAAE